MAEALACETSACIGSLVMLNVDSGVGIGVGAVGATVGSAVGVGVGAVGDSVGDTVGTGVGEVGSAVGMKRASLSVCASIAENIVFKDDTTNIP